MTGTPPSALLISFPKVGGVAHKEKTCVCVSMENANEATQMSRIVCAGLSDGVATKYCVWLEEKKKKKLYTEFLVLEWLGVSAPGVV